MWTEMEECNPDISLYKTLFSWQNSPDESEIQAKGHKNMVWWLTYSSHPSNLVNLVCSYVTTAKSYNNIAWL